MKTTPPTNPNPSLYPNLDSYEAMIFLDLPDPKKLSNTHVVEGLRSFVKSEKKILAVVLTYIREVERREIFHSSDCSSLFEFLTDELGYSNGAAQSRIDGSRLLKEMPEIKKDFETGDLNLTQASIIASGIRQKERENRLARSKGGHEKSATETLLPIKVSLEEKVKIIELLKNKSLPESQMLVAKTLNIEPKKADKKVVQKDKSVRIEMTLSEGQFNLVSQVKELTSHINPGASIPELLEFLAKDYIKRKDPGMNRKAKIVIENRVGDSEKDVAGRAQINLESKVTTESEVKSATQNKTMVEKNQLKRVSPRQPISRATERFVYQRYQSCQWRMAEKNGQARLCGSRFQLEIDHIKSKWLGGDDRPDNLQLLCRTHNLLKYKIEVNKTI